MLFNLPMNFTPVCTTELGHIAGLKPQSDVRNTKVVELGAHPVGDHRHWATDIEETQDHAVTVPIIGDPELTVPRLYDRVSANPGGIARGPTAADHAIMRSVFVIGPDKKDQGDADLSHEHRHEF